MLVLLMEQGLKHAKKEGHAHLGVAGGGRAENRQEKKKINHIWKMLDTRKTSGPTHLKYADGARPEFIEEKQGTANWVDAGEEKPNYRKTKASHIWELEMEQLGR